MDLVQQEDKSSRKENTMKVDEALEVLKKYNKWRRGKGKKYSQPGFPDDLTPELIGLSIDRAIQMMKHYIPREDFLVLNEIVDEWIHNRKAARIKLTDAQKVAIRKMAKTVRQISITNAG